MASSQCPQKYVPTTSLGVADLVRYKQDAADLLTNNEQPEDSIPASHGPHATYSIINIDLQSIMSSTHPADLLHYQPDHKVIICTSCQYALQPTSISRHLKDIHHILRSHRKPFVEYASRFELDDPGTIIRSTDDLAVFPVPGLPVLDGLICNHEGCSHLCVSEKRMRYHWNLQHARAGTTESDWSSVPLQTFFRGNSLRYFTKTSLCRSRSNHPQNSTDFIGDDEAALMQHYIYSTSFTLTDEAIPLTDKDPAYEHIDISIWQDIVPELAKNSPFLRHGIMACSALHLAYLCQPHRQSYSITAAKHQDIAIPEFRSAMHSFNELHCHAVLAFIHILCICSLACERDNERLLIVDPDGPGAVSDWLAFLRSGCGFVQSVRHIVQDGPVKALLCYSVLPEDLYGLPQPPCTDRLLAAIPSSDSRDAWSNTECDVYRTAVQELGYAFLYAERLGSKFNIWTALRVWPMMVSLQYFQMLRGYHPAALIALAQYCVLMNKLDGKWYAEGRAKRLLSHVLQRLDLKWHTYIEWPSKS